jgi:ABC-type Fe3+-hydroxamate transport system substrate-binding protein
MVVGGGSYLDELLDIAGADNVFADSPSPSPQVSIEEIAKRDPQLVLAGDTGSGEFARTPAWNAVTAVRTGNIRRIDSRLTGRTSVNLGMAAASLARVIHPDRADRIP